MKYQKLILVISVVTTVFLIFSSSGMNFHDQKSTITVEPHPISSSSSANMVHEWNHHNSSSVLKQEEQNSFGTTSPVKYYFNFTESGLPSGSSWTVTVDGSPIRYVGNVLSLKVDSGTYINYTISQTSSYYPNITSGSVKVQNSNVNVSFRYIHFSYIIGTINPKNSSLIINDVLQKSTNGSFSFSVAVGTFQLEVIKTGFNTYYKNFTLAPGQTENLSINLTKASPSQPTYSPPPNQPTSSILIYAVIGAAAVIAILAVSAIIYRKNRR